MMLLFALSERYIIVAQIVSKCRGVEFYSSQLRKYVMGSIFYHFASAIKGNIFGAGHFVKEVE